MELIEFVNLLKTGHEVEVVFEGRPFFVSYLYALSDESKKKYADILKLDNRIYYISDETIKTEIFIGDFSGVFEYEFKPGISISNHPEKFDIIMWY